MSLDSEFDFFFSILKFVWWFKLQIVGIGNVGLALNTNTIW